MNQIIKLKCPACKKTHNVKIRAIIELDEKFDPKTVKHVYQCKETNKSVFVSVAV